MHPNLPDQAHTKLGLGTVQLGLKYGIRQHDQKPPSLKTCHEIVTQALNSGITTLDTAFEYGHSEVTLGSVPATRQFPKIITKTPKFRSGTLFQSTAKLLKQAYAISLETLGLDSCYGLMIHDANNLKQPGGDYLADAMMELRAGGLVTKIGVSVYDPEETFDLFSKFDFNLVQIPFNIADQRFLSSGSLEWLKSRAIEVHARSAFLQGVLGMSARELPNGLDAFAQTLNELQRRCSEFGYKAEAACLQFAIQSSNIDSVVVGVNTLDQLNQLVEWSNVPLPGDFDITPLPVLDPTLLNPSTWAQRINI
jgi:aryl-alcohol dehydrogenase-like predicted oxidoreductase